MTNILQRALNTYSISRMILENYNIVAPYGEIVNNFVLYPLLIEIIKHKTIVIVILAFL